MAQGRRRSREKEVTPKWGKSKGVKFGGFRGKKSPVVGALPGRKGRQRGLGQGENWPKQKKRHAQRARPSSNGIHWRGQKRG